MSKSIKTGFGSQEKTYIDLDKWARKEHYDFFIQFKEPYFSMTANVECTDAYRFAKERKINFYFMYLYISLEVMNRIEEFRLRIEGDEVVCFNRINGGSTVLRDDKTVGFTHLLYEKDFKTFYRLAEEETIRVKKQTGLVVPDMGEGVVYYTSMPWVSFTALKHAVNDPGELSMPRVVFGKYFEDRGKLLMPVALDVHHALMDGYHAGVFYNQFEAALQDPGKFISI